MLTAHMNSSVEFLSFCKASFKLFFDKSVTQFLKSKLPFFYVLQEKSLSAATGRVVTRSLPAQMNCRGTVELTRERRSLLVLCVSAASCAAITWQSTPAAIWPQRRSPAGSRRLANSTELPQQRNRKAAALWVCSSPCHHLFVKASERKLLLYKLSEHQEELLWPQQNWEWLFSPAFVYTLVSFSLGPLLLKLCEKSYHIFPGPFPVCVFFQYLGECNHQHFRKAELFGNYFGNRLKKSLVMLAVNILVDRETRWFLY